MNVDAKSASNRYVAYVILLLTVVNVFNYMDRMALAVLMPSIKSDLELSDGQLGLLVGFAFSVFYAICGLPLARWADHGIRRNIIALALATWSLMTALSGAAQSFWHLFVARVGVGAGEAGCIPPAQSILCDYVPVQRRSGVFAIHSVGLIAGMMLGMALAGWLNEVIGWRWAFVALGLPGICVAVIVRLTLHEPARGVFDGEERDGAEASLRDTIAALWSCRTYRWLLFYIVLNGFVQFGMNQWWPSFYVRVHGLSLSSVGVYLGMAVGVGSGIGLLMGGFLGNKVAERNIRFPLVIGAAGSFTAAVTALCFLFVRSSSRSMLLVALTGLLWSVANAPAVAALYSVIKPGMRAMGGAISIFCASALGFGLGPTCVGLLSDLLVPQFGETSLRYALLVPAGLLPVTAAALYMASRSLPCDLRWAQANLTKGYQPGAKSPASQGEREEPRSKAPVSLRPSGGGNAA